MRERWRDVPECSKYQVSDAGRIRKKATRKILRGGTSRYRSFTPIDDAGKQRCLSIHKLVLVVFVGPPPPGMEARHLDGDGHNNHLWNLRWGTKSQNNGSDKARHGRLIFGEKNAQAKLTEDAVREIRATKRGTLALAKRYGVSLTIIKSARSGRTWKHVV